MERRTDGDMRRLRDGLTEIPSIPKDEQTARLAEETYVWISLILKFFKLLRSELCQKFVDIKVIESRLFLLLTPGCFHG